MKAGRASGCLRKSKGTVEGDAATLARAPVFRQLERRWMWNAAGCRWNAAAWNGAGSGRLRGPLQTRDRSLSRSARPARLGGRSGASVRTARTSTIKAERNASLICRSVHWLPTVPRHATAASQASRPAPRRGRASRCRSAAEPASGALAELAAAQRRDGGCDHHGSSAV